MRVAAFALAFVAGPVAAQPLTEADTALVERYLAALEVGTDGGPEEDAVRAGFYANYQPGALAELVDFIEGPLLERVRRLDDAALAPVGDVDPALARRYVEGARRATFPMDAQRRVAEAMARSIGNGFAPLSLDGAGEIKDFDELVDGLLNDFGPDEEAEIAEAQRYLARLSHDDAVALVTFFESDAARYQGDVLGDAVADGLIEQIKTSPPPPRPPPPRPPPPPLPAPRAPDCQADPEVFDAPQLMPELIGGLEGLQARLEYPESARRASVEGQVVVQFVVDERGGVLDPVVVGGTDEVLSEAAIGVVSGSRFVPGQHCGRPVKTRFAVPVTFRLP